MSEFSFKLRLRRRPIRLTLGFLAGLIFGPVLAISFYRLPACELLGYYERPNRDHEPIMVIAAIIGLGYGAAVGLVTSFCAWLTQRLIWDIWEPNRDLSDREADMSLVPTNHEAAPDERVSRRTDIAGSLGEGIAPVP